MEPIMIKKLTEELIKELKKLSTEDKIDEINFIRGEISKVSPFLGHPVDFIKWVKNDLVYANDYNPNTVAPPEMELLRLSIYKDGYTQPIVSMKDEDDKFEVIDGFHRHRVGKEYIEISKSIHGYLPIVQIRNSVTNKQDRMASTIRHNRARGKHRIEAMSDIVIELSRRNWSDEKIAKNLGMDADEVLRLKQISGLAEMFSDQDFSEAWDVDFNEDDDFIELE
ncbi:MAG: ParB/RepB/Spo0J family partition protein [Candidatus Gastranaerophilaceae bacterium]|jgi:ParB-like chromosome segregation protein Spo0J